MSHFTVAVITKRKDTNEVSKLLKPYWEGLTDEDYNEEAKWDWYSIGGRWNNTLVVDKDNEDVYDVADWGLGMDETNDVKEHPELKRVNGARIKDIKFELMGGDYDEAIRTWEVIVEGDEPRNEKEEKIKQFNYYKPEYYTEQYGTKENYAKLQSMFYTWAFLNEDGWVEQGNMGFWAMSDATKDSRTEYVKKFNEYIKLPEHQDEYLFIVDCHI